MQMRTRWYLTLNLLTTTIVAPPSNDSKWQMGFNSAFKGLIRVPLRRGFTIIRSQAWNEYINTEFKVPQL
jgi:hypothetical protein